MNKKSSYTLLFLFVQICFVYAQQLTTDNSLQPNQLIQNLVGDNCAAASNVSSQINGSINNIVSFGSFDRGTSNFPLQSGIVLSTGNVTSAGNTFIGEDLSDGEIDWTTDADVLDVLGIDQTLNATSIEFDFVSANNFVAFKYLFASDEYQQEYPCNFQDVFAILIKRAGTADPYVNIALVPETTTVVSTNTIHPNINGFCEAQNEDYFQGYNVGASNFNGQTTVLSANTDVIPNETYHIKFIIADHIDERFDSAVFIEAEGFGNSIDLGPDQSVCGNDITLNADISNAAAAYAWFLNGTPIAGETNPILEVDETGIYSIEITLPVTGGSCVLTDSIDIEIIPFQNAAPIEDLAVCDPAPSDGIFDFDFSALKDDEILAELPSTDFTITYHLSQEDAQNGNNPIGGIYQNTESAEIIFVRIESLTGDCLQLGSFNIMVDVAPNTLEFTINMCNGIISDFGIINLSSLDFRVSNSEFNRTVTYYLTEDDALNQINPLDDIPILDSEPPYFIGRVEDNFNGCFSLVRIYFNYQNSPDLGIDRFIIDACLDPNYIEIIPGSENYTYASVPLPFNLEDALADVQDTFPGANVRIVTFLGLTTLPRIWTVTNPTSFSFDIGVSFDETFCEEIITIELHKNLLFNVLGGDNSIDICDDTLNDGIVDIDLVDIGDTLSDGYEINFQFYETEDDRDTNENPINPLLPYTVNTPTKELFFTSSHDECTYASKVMFQIIEAPIVLPQSVEACGSFNSELNTTTIQLNPFIGQMTQGLVGVSAAFFSTADDAQNNEDNIASIEVVGNFAQVFTRITNILTGCSSVTTLDIDILETLDIDAPSPIVACDDDQDGFSIVNLENVIDELMIDINDFDISFHETLANAANDRNAIPNPESFNTQTQDIYIRLQRVNLECYTVVDFEVLIYDKPVLANNLSFINCTDDTNNAADFVFEDKDADLINGQENMQVLYFETENDAIDRIGNIDKTVAYQNTTNPQTIFVRLENELETSCFRVAPLQIEVRQAPIYNLPSDVFECDIDNNGLASTDLNEKITEISLNSPTDLNISFYLTALNAELGTANIPLDFSPTSNPQLIYAKIENVDSECYDIQTFFINTLSLPEVNYGQSLIICGNNNDLSLQWNLTDIELFILEGRQFGIDFTYFESETDLQNDTDPIIDPETYSNTSNPQTVFVSVRNTVTGCFTSVPFELIINSPPQVIPLETFEVCDNATNSVDLLDINNVLLENTFNILVSYHANQVDADSNENPLNTDYTYTNTIENLVARVEFSTTGCYATYPFQLVINPLPVANQPNNLIACDDDFDDVLEFDLTTQNTAILNGQNPNDFSVSYFNTLDDAVDNLQPLPTNYVASNGEVIFVRLKNNTTDCFDTTQFSVLINPLPLVTIEDQVLCLNDLPLVVSAETNNTLDSYLWSTNATTAEIDIVETGTYSVTVTNQFGCESTSAFNVTESESATIDVVETIDFSDPNNITVTINGIGNYLYQLNDLPFQTSNVFVNVPIGYNTITIIDQNGCARVTRDVLVIDAPKHMTPNDDGDFDTWHIAGVETLPGTIIHIFDRYGKLLKQIGHNTLGWNGTFNGKPMPPDDYWYVANVMQNGERFQIKGHFSLKR